MLFWTVKRPVCEGMPTRPNQMMLLSQRTSVASSCCAKQAGRPVVACTSVRATRRAYLGGASSLVSLSLLPSPSQAEYAVIDTPTPKNAIQENPAVRPALTVPQYISKIETARPAVYELFTDLAEVGSFKNISDDLNIDPFDSIAQSVFYLPWALLAVDPAKAQDCYDECLRYQDSIGKFDRLLYKAAHQPDVDEVQVLAALKELLGVQLDRVLATVR